MFSLALLMFSVTLEDLRYEFKPVGRDMPIVTDSLSRWKKKNPRSTDPMADRYVIVTYTVKQRCVTLQLFRSLGGSPVYCYDLYKNDFIESRDDVE